MVMKNTTFYICLECDHATELEVFWDEQGGEYAELPEACEECGEPTDVGPSVNDGHRSERRQMGVTD
jgi:hypothetical protein